MANYLLMERIKETREPKNRKSNVHCSIETKEADC
jgi:hypothetical protein